MTDLDSLIQPARDTSDHIRLNVISKLSSRAENKPRQFLAAVLARSNRLLSGMISLYDSGYVDLVGMHLRVILENWFVGEYLIMAPDEAMKVLHEANVEQLRRMGNAGWSHLGEFAQQLDFDARAINWVNVAERIDKLFKETWANEASEYGKTMYDSI